VGAAAVEVAGQLDDHQAVMLLAYLGLQVAAVARRALSRKRFA
jgi:hypothetical protein